MKYSLLLGTFAISGLTAAENLEARIDCNKDSCFHAALDDSKGRLSCQSFMAKTVASAIVIATVTSTYTHFNNNKLNPTTTVASVKSITSDKSGHYTVTPTIVPESISLACGSGIDSEKKIQDKYSSACSCYYRPKTLSVATATVTSVEFLPTTVSDFRLMVLFDNGTTSYAVDNSTSDSWSTITYIGLEQNTKNPALFALAPDSRLRLESQGKVSMVQETYHNFEVITLYPFPLAFVNDSTTSHFKPMGFHITDTHNSGNASIFTVGVSPVTDDEYDFRGDPASTHNMTVIMACDKDFHGLCIGTPAFQNEFFDAGNKTSKDGKYHLVQLQAVPMF
ncbi:uncharacterized protein LY89DRAFT_780299 [Mollisia scopiformis]|uniref:Uncharacterized protein n=1 Tax=Mollisia scopiformis TaxID=149040 RepID=A0A194XHT7_MOLSC|nr:uncharacterized protein LY89DRAFT_780299 [Mollisia scopiformis]KUJ19337.1 hypothetical protein LY89DRAFT_780299 [Mollisia scopiformis]